MEEKKSSLGKWVIRVVLLATLSLFIASAGLAFWFYSYTEGKVHSVESGQKVTVIIPKGATFLEIQKLLGEKKLIKDDVRFTLLARYLKLSHKLKAGEFQLTTGKKPADLLQELVDAKPVQHSITIPEGLHIKEIASIFAKKDWCSYDEFVRLTTDKKFIKSLGFNDISSLEGYLFPDTYYVTREMRNAKAVIELMTDRFKDVWENSQVNGVELSLTQHELVTLASIVEKEAVKASEQPIIAGVFYNRLKKRMRLQSDPTVLYGVENHTGPITKTDLRRKTPYNTYVILGLPPGPICNPGEGAIKGTLAPTASKYLYFVSNNDGTHQFSKNLKEHNRAVQNYRKSVREARKAAQQNKTASQ